VKVRVTTNRPDLAATTSCSASKQSLEEAMTNTIGRVRELWRYPVKSMGGERLQTASIGPLGVVGDRGWATRDEQAGEIRGAKKLPALLQCSARYVEEPSPGRIPVAEIELPDGTRVQSDAPEAAARLSALVGRQVSLWPLQPEAAREHYRRAAPDNPDFEAELREIFGRLPDEPLPDLALFPAEIFEFASPLGTYFDAYPLHLMTTATLAEMARRNASARFDVRRFRPNIVVEFEGAGEANAEAAWCGAELRIGEVRLPIPVPCPRCVMTTLPQGDLPKDPSVLRSIVRDAGQNLGVYATVGAPGRIAVGDPVELVSPA
jgi:MOSC domain-containing protein